MNNLKRLSVAFTFVLALSVPAIADGPAPCTPGDISTPPCSSAQYTNDSTDPGDISIPPASGAVDFVTFAEDALLDALIF